MKKMLALVAVCASASLAQAEAMRTIETRENKLPDPGRFEVGGMFRFMEQKDTGEQFTKVDEDVQVWMPYGRYGVTEEFSVNASLPYLRTSSDGGDDENEMGDLTIGAELIAYQDIFGYPWVMPYLDLSLPTGDAGFGYSSDDPVLTPGISIGTVTWECVTWIADVRYAINKNDENIATVGGSIIWDVSKKFALIAEGSFTEKMEHEEDDHQLLQAGFSYKPTRRVQAGIFGGTEVEGPSDVVVTAKVSVQF